MDVKVNTAGLTGTSAAGALSGVKKASGVEQTAKTAETSAIKAPNVDEVELSDKAVRYLTEESSSETGSADISKSESVSDSVSKLVSDSGDTVLTSELYSYTETELQELMLNGTITRLEYEAELEKRSGVDIVSGE